MNDFERRLLDVYSNSSWLAGVVSKSKEIIDIDYFTYPVTIENVASGASASASIQIQSDSVFALTYMSGNQVVNNAVVNNPVTTLQITDTGSGKTFFSTPALFGLVMGTAGQPFLLPQPRVIPPNVNITFNLTNVFSAAAATYYISLMGARIYYAS